MSRDWTPREALAAEELQISAGLGNYFDFLHNSHWVIDGEKVPLCVEKEIGLRQSYPMLGKLMDNFMDLYSQLAAIPGGLEYLSLKDLALAEYVEQGTGDPNTPLIQWFEGKLDPGFYYREHNDQLLLESMVAEAKEQAQAIQQPLTNRLDNAKARVQDVASNEDINTKDKGR